MLFAVDGHFQCQRAIKVLCVLRCGCYVLWCRWPFKFFGCVTHVNVRQSARLSSLCRLKCSSLQKQLACESCRLPQQVSSLLWLFSWFRRVISSCRSFDKHASGRSSLTGLLGPLVSVWILRLLFFFSSSSVSLWLRCRSVVALALALILRTCTLAMSDQEYAGAFVPDVPQPRIRDRRVVSPGEPDRFFERIVGWPVDGVTVSVPCESPSGVGATMRRDMETRKGGVCVCC